MGFQGHKCGPADEQLTADGGDQDNSVLIFAICVRETCSFEWAFAYSFYIPGTKKNLLSKLFIMLIIFTVFFSEQLLNIF